MIEREFRGDSFNNTSLLSTLDKINYEMAIDTDTFDGYSVIGIVLHVMYWKWYLLNKCLNYTSDFKYENQDWPSIPEKIDKKNWECIRQELVDIHDIFIDSLKKLDVADLDKKFTEWNQKVYSYERMFIDSSVHDIFHTGQIRNMGLSIFKDK